MASKAGGARTPGRHATHPHLGQSICRTASVARATAASTSNAVSDVIDRIVVSIEDGRGYDLERAVIGAALSHFDLAARRHMRAGLQAAWDHPTASTDTACVEHVDEAVRQLIEGGIDGERLCWAVISHESTLQYPLVLHEANRMARAYGDWAAADLIGFAWRGLRLALRNYDVTSGNTFATYACPKIRGSMLDGIRSEHHLPKRLVTFTNKANHATADLTAHLGRPPTFAELADSLDVPISDVISLPRYQAPSSLDLTVDDVTSHGRQVPSDHDTEHEAISHLGTQVLADSLNHLDVDDAEAIRLLILDDFTISQAAELTGISSRQLRIRRDRGLAQLRDQLSTWVGA